MQKHIYTKCDTAEIYSTGLLCRKALPRPSHCGRPLTRVSKVECQGQGEALCSCLVPVKGVLAMRKQITVMVVVVVLGTLLIAVRQSAQQLRQGGWASGDDSIAKQMIQMERDWAEDGCTQKADVKAFLADTSE